MQNAIILFAFLMLAPTCFSKLKILTVLPLKHDSRLTSSWERGLEILPGAQVAIEQVNQDMPPVYQLDLEVVDSGDPTALINLMNRTFYQDNNIIGAIGIFNPHTLSGLTYHKHSLVVSSTPYITHDLPQAASPYYFHMLQPADVFADAFLRLSTELGWKRIAIVADFTDDYYLGVAEELYDKASASEGFGIIPFLQLQKEYETSVVSVDFFFRNLKRFRSNVIFLNLGAGKVVGVLCAAKERGLTWPNYAWIVYSVSSVHLVHVEHISATCNVYDALEGVVLLEHKLIPTKKGTLDIGYTYSGYYSSYERSLNNLSSVKNISLIPNTFANILHDSVWVYALALRSQMTRLSNITSFHLVDSVRNIAFNGASGHVQFNANSGRLTGVSISQVRNKKIVDQGYYHPDWKNITFTGRLRGGSSPSSDLIIVTDQASLLYTSFLSICLILCVVFVTFVLILYVYYRKEPEIKSTSITLSLLMFLGCYIILFYLLLAVIYTQSLVSSTSSFNICTALAWLNISGISIPLILATLLVKMLRVYHIFTLYGKIGKMCSDTALLLYVLLLMSPCTLILIFWSALDPYTAQTRITENPGYTEIEQRCFSQYLLVWIGLLIVNLLVLIVANLIVAVKTRKIRQNHFKDTKKVNAFLFVFLMLLLLTVSYWMIFRTIGAKKRYTDITLHVSHIIIVVCCQGFLFVPKVLPPLQRSLSKKYRLQHNSSQGSSKTHSTAVTLSTN